MLTTMYLIRHSEKMPLPFGYDRIQPLTARGERRAEALLQLEELRHADAAYCSPFARTVATLRYLAEADGLSLRLDEGRCSVEIQAAVTCQGRTGVEMEALPAAATAALTVYDMCKAVQRDMVITDLLLWFQGDGDNALGAGLLEK